MKLKYDLYSANANCGHCVNKYHKMDQSSNDPGYCSIIASLVDDDYYCSFYRMIPIKEKTVVDPSGAMVQIQDKRRPKKL